MKQVFMRRLRFPFFARGQYLCTAPARKKNEIQLDFSKSTQRVGLPFILNLHFFYTLNRPVLPGGQNYDLHQPKVSIKSAWSLELI